MAGTWVRSWEELSLARAARPGNAAVGEDRYGWIGPSLRSFDQDPGFAEMLQAVLAESRFEAARLTLEITESSLMDDIDATAAILLRLKTLGLRLAIDDFGIGYSSLSYLERLPIDVLKIDRSFIAALRRGSEVPVLVRSIIKLGQTLRMDVLAEGIEREEQLARLRELGCRLGQGFYFSPPVPASGAEAVLSQRWPIALTG